MLYDYTKNKDDLFHPENEPHCLLPRVGFSDDLLCAELSRLAYTDENGTSIKTLDKIGFSQVEWIEKENNQALLAWNKDLSKGIMADVKLSLDDHPDNTMGKIHKGFYKAFASLKTNIESWTQDKTGTWLITGHSLGAAMATIAATILNMPNEMKLFTIGSPRVGNDEFFTAFHKRGISSKRYVNCCDIVCRIPLDIPLVDDYKHIEQELYINGDGKIYSNPSEIETQKKQDQYLMFSRTLTDHTPLNYVRALACNDGYQLL